MIDHNRNNRAIGRKNLEGAKEQTLGDCVKKSCSRRKLRGPVPLPPQLPKFKKHFRPHIFLQDNRFLPGSHEHKVPLCVSVCTGLSRLCVDPQLQGQKHRERKGTRTTSCPESWNLKITPQWGFYSDPPTVSCVCISQEVIRVFCLWIRGTVKIILTIIYSARPSKRYSLCVFESSYQSVVG